MSEEKSLELRVSVDVGYRRHSVAIGLLAVLLNATKELLNNQAIRALGRHLCRIIYKMLKEERPYEIRPKKGDTQARVRSRSCVKTKIRRPKISAKS